MRVQAQHRIRLHDVEDLRDREPGRHLDAQAEGRLGATDALWLEDVAQWRSEEHTSELQSLMRISYAVFCLKKKKKLITHLTCNTNNDNRRTEHDHTMEHAYRHNA